MEPIIEVKNVNLKYDEGKSNETDALKDINLKIFPEEYIIIFGPSGCGKSTLLYCLSGLQRPSSGEISVSGRELSATTPQKDMVNIHRFEIGMIFQAYYLIPSLNILDNVILPQVFCNAPALKRRKKAEELLEHFEILGQAKKYPSELSGGQKQRVSIARSMVNDPSIIIADEPVGNLDSQSTSVVMDLLEELNSKFKKTVILVTHDDRFLHYAHRVFYMKDGQIIKEVVNDKKEGPVTTKHKQQGIIDQMSLIYPSLSQEQLMAKALTQHLLTNLSPIEVDRLEKIITMRVKGEIETSSFVEKLDKSFEDGGVGLYKQTANDFSQKVEEILTLAQLVKSDTGEGDSKGVIGILGHLLKGSDYSSLTQEQYKQLKSFVEKRLKGEIKAEDLEKKLDTPINNGGVGLNSRTAKNFARELEIILGQIIS